MQLPFFLNLFWWKQRLSHLFKKPSSPLTTLYKNLDLRLVNHVRSGGMPSWAQMRHFSEFLSAREKKHLRICLLIITLSVFVISGNYLWTHHTIKPARGGEYTEGIIGTPNFINPLFYKILYILRDYKRLKEITKEAIEETSPIMINIIANIVKRIFPALKLSLLMFGFSKRSLNKFATLIFI